MKNSNAHDHQGQQCPAQAPSSKPDSAITALPCAHTGNLRSVGDKFTPETAIPCPCCHQMTMERAWFPPLLKNREGSWSYHCMDETCAGFHQTLSLEQYTERYGSK